MITKIAYTSYPVTDMDRAVEFYHDLLGLDLLFKRADWSEFMIGGQHLAIHKVESPLAKNNQTGARVSFRACPIEAVVEQLKAKGVRFTGELEVHPYGKMIYFLDPDDNLLGLYEPPANDRGE